MITKGDTAKHVSFVFLFFLLDLLSERLVCRQVVQFKNEWPFSHMSSCFYMNFIRLRSYLN